MISEDFARELATEPAGRARASASERPLTGCLARGDRRGAERPRGRVVRGSAEPRVLARAHGERFGNSRRVGTPAVAFVIRSERAGTASLIERGPASGLVGEREISRSRSERTMQDLYAGSLARTSFTLVMLAIAGGDGACCSASSGSTASSLTSFRSGREKSGFASALGAEPPAGSRGCSCCTGSR